ncbi:rod shape-determining protein MreC [Acidiferrobacter sp.]|jgi:rod shape-determining protein MreC|uniref:rod shape-determining protein MreC n=1 Tax=Acidiferrobacter sp. TaxID=1872107 RepID=UPI00261EC82B|nr:rod shape-determining protein MreC [Acidiferrobacter sp.]
MGTFLGWSFKRPSNLAKLIVFACASVILMVADAHHNRDARLVRGTLLRADHPLQELAALPLALMHDASRDLRLNGRLRQENARLRARERRLEIKVSRLATLRLEVAHLRALLHGSAIPGYRAGLARILDVGSGPFKQRLTLNEGKNDHVFIGQAVIDAHGIVGQVVSVNRDTSRVMLITDPDSGVPVISERNGLRAIVFGTGSPDGVKIPYLTVTADIRPGDIFVSSGLGGIYPPGYPVARVTKITSNPNLAFLKIRAVPLAHLSYHTHVLLLWPRAHARTQGTHHG